MILWTCSPGSSLYKDIFYRTLHPVFLIRALSGWNRALFGCGSKAPGRNPWSETGLNPIRKEAPWTTGNSARPTTTAKRSSARVRWGIGCIVIQSGRASVTRCREGGAVRGFTDLKAGEFFGELAIIESEVRSATVQAIGRRTVLSIDKKNFLRRVHEDPSLVAYHDPGAD